MQMRVLTAVALYSGLYNIILLACHLQVNGARIRRDSNTKCIDLTEEEKLRLLGAGRENNHLYEHPYLTWQESQREYFRRKRNLTIETDENMERRKCPNTNLELRNYFGAVCRSYHITTSHPRRFPEIIQETICVNAGECKWCLVEARHKENYICEQIYVYMPVLKRTKCERNELAVYARVFDPIGIGCQCVRRKNINS